MDFENAYQKFLDGTATPEEEAGGEKLYGLITRLLNDGRRRETMSRALRDMGVPDAAEQIYRVLTGLLDRKKG